jgi:hypothetical protein
MALVPGQAPLRAPGLAGGKQEGPGLGVSTAEGVPSLGSVRGQGEAFPESLTPRLGCLGALLLHTLY